MQHYKRLAVYGTLKKGFRNHYLLRGCKALGTFRTAASFQLYDLGPYPALIDGGRTPIAVEVYRLSARRLQKIDVLEETPSLYHRAKIHIKPIGECFIYLLNRPPSKLRRFRRLQSGHWP